jgi:hypothetical protein
LFGLRKAKKSNPGLDRSRKDTALARKPLMRQAVESRLENWSTDGDNVA